MFHSIRVRIAVLYGILFVVIVSLGSVFFYLQLARALYGQLDRGLAAAAAEFGSDEYFTAAGIKPAALAHADEDGAALLAQYSVQLFGLSGPVRDAQGSPLLLQNAAALPAVNQARQHKISSYHDIEAAGQTSFRVYTAPVILHGQLVGAVQVATPTSAAAAALASVRTFTMAGLAAMVAALAAFGLWVAGRAMSPVARLIAAARDITASDLSRRLPVHNEKDELGRLAVTINEMIARLDQAFARERQFVADASHALTTPVTVIAGNAELLAQDLGAGRTPDPAMLQDLIAETERLSELVQRLLDLARLDKTSTPPRIVLFDLAALARRAVARPNVPGLTLKADVPETLYVHGDAGEIEELLDNLVDNAIKYTPPPGKVSVTATMRQGQVELTVKDTGPGIPREHLAHLGQRFYRVHPEAVPGQPRGTGLGLAICREIMSRHGGRLEIESEPGLGTTVTAKWPAAPGPRQATG